MMNEEEILEESFGKGTHHFPRDWRVYTYTDTHTHAERERKGGSLIQGK